MMPARDHTLAKTFMDYIKLSSDEIADEIDISLTGRKRRCSDGYSGTNKAHLLVRLIVCASMILILQGDKGHYHSCYALGIVLDDCE